MQMVLNVLWCAGAVPLRPHQDFDSVPTVSNISVSSAAAAPVENVEYVQFLEQLVGELSNVFAHWVHQNPPVSAQDVDDMYRRHCSPGSPLPDLIPSADTKWQSSPCRDLRVRRGLDPMPRFRLNSVGSAGGSSTASSPASTPSTPVSPSPMNFDLITPSSSASTATYYPSPSTHFYYPPSPPASASTAAPLPSEWPAASAESDAPADDVADGSDCSAEWRRVGRELRSIADSFASTRPPAQNLQRSNWSLVGNGLLSSLGPLASPLVSALAVYFWWKVVRRLA